MNFDIFLALVTKAARTRGYKIELNRDGLTQIDFGNKKLHAGHLKSIFPAIMEPSANISSLIEKVAPGRPCAHKPMKEIIKMISSEIDGSANAQA